MTRLAVDLGTSHTVAVIERPGQPARPLLFDGSPVLPSGVFAAADGAIHTGRDADRLAQIEPHRYEPHPKRRVDEGTVLLGDAEYPVATLLAAVLARVLHEAGLPHGSTVVLTCPSDWGRLRRTVLLDAARMAGIADPVLVDEPVAAAAYCTRVLGGHVPHGQSLLVFDFGGGTLDLALVRLDPAGTRVLGVGGLENLGGLDVDDALIGHLGHVIAARDPARWQRLAHPSGPAELRDRRALWAEVRVAKEMLSRTTSAPVPLPGGSDPLHLTREELDRLAGPLIDRAVDETRRLLDGVGRSGVPVSLGAILLVGGSSRIPLVSTRLHGRFGVAPMVPEQPELPVALGALAALADGPATGGGFGGAPGGPGGAFGGAFGGAPASGAPGAVGGAFGGAPASGAPGAVGGAPVSAVPGGTPVSAVPVSGDPARPWTGRAGGGADIGSRTGDPWTTDQPSWPPAVPRQPGPAVPTQPGPGGPTQPGPGGQFGGQPGSGRPIGYPDQRTRPGSRRAGGPRGATVLAIAASLALVVLAAATIWFVRDAVGGSGNGNRGDNPAANSGTSAGTSPAATRGPLPNGYTWCDTLGQSVFCPTEPYCEDADDIEIGCAEAHRYQVFVAGHLPDGTDVSSKEIADRPEVKAACSEEMLDARSIDPRTTEGWAIYSEATLINFAIEVFLCHAGPRSGTTKDNVFKPVT